MEWVFRVGLFFRFMNCYGNVSWMTSICQIQHPKRKGPFVALTQTPDKIIMLCSQVG